MATQQLACCILLCLATSLGERLWIDRTAAGRFQVVSEAGPIGDEGTIRGAGGWKRLVDAKAYGVDAGRTWHVTDLPGTVPEAEANGLRFSSGIWMPHAKRFYENCTDMDSDPFWQKEVASYLKEVRRYKGSSAILWWTVGNEVEMEVNVVLGSECVWKRVNWVAARVKAEDPDHPVGIVLAGAHPDKVKMVVRLVTSIDFLGINTYGDSSLGVGRALKSAGWTKPYAITEFGPTGHWEAPVTIWDSYIEESSSQKVPRYLATCNSCKADPLCVGSFAFVWGWKWEKTGTWYGMFNEWPAVTENMSVPCPGCESETVAIMEECWSGTRRKNPAPSISGVVVGKRRLPGMRFSVERGPVVPLRVEAAHALDHKLTAVWAVTEEVVSNAVGGAFEATNPLVSGLWSGSKEDLAIGLGAVLDTSRLPPGDAYRLYVFVREDPKSLGPNETFPLHEASATLPFHICHTAQPTEECYEHVQYAQRIGIRVDRGAYPGVTPSSSFGEVQMSLYMKGDRTCGMPCGLEEYCHTATRWETCYDHVKWALLTGIERHPEMYPGLKNTSSFVDVQRFLYRERNGLCTRPCHDGPLEDFRDTRPPAGSEEAAANGARRPGALGPLLLALLPAALAVAVADA
uniref:Glycoside hydrolase family 2 catalytic domain-containing protein n=1 Tax=Alexandrium catenella TaxID=2925 RepID=A0A7S1M6W9_ALECA|mmetsp:Transcript_20890/g.57072  ORF Transcript_20890/g.57072 Transcript_20890/m.57072 type:complete len:630 (+) Transcript_20890:71-1960(+)